MREEVLAQIMEELQTNFKADMLKQVSERIKEASKTQDRSVHELREALEE